MKPSGASRMQLVGHLRRQLVEILEDRPCLAVLYGSSAVREWIAPTSDFDVLIIGTFPALSLREALVSAVMSTHREFGLSLDFAVPYESKVCCELDECRAALQGDGFRGANGTFEIVECDSPEYLSSRAMILRLTVTALATRKQLLLGKGDLLPPLEAAAWRTLKGVVRTTQPSFPDKFSFDVAKFQRGMVNSAGTRVERCYKSYLGFPESDEMTKYIKTKLEEPYQGDIDSDLERVFIHLRRREKN